MLKMYLIREVLHLVSAVFGTAIAVQAINKSPPYGHLVPDKEKRLRESFQRPVPRLWIRSAEEWGERRYENRNTTAESFQNDWPIIALPFVYQIVSKLISEHMVMCE